MDTAPTTLLTVGEAARRAGVGERTIGRWLSVGELPIAARAGATRMRLIDPRDLDAVVAARRAARGRR